MPPKVIASILALVALLVYGVWFFQTYPDQKRACERDGGTMVKGSGIQNGHGYVCVDAKDITVSR